MNGILDNIAQLHRYYDPFQPGYVSYLVDTNGKHINVAMSDNELGLFEKLFPHIEIISTPMIKKEGAQ